MLQIFNNFGYFLKFSENYLVPSLSSFMGQSNWINAYCLKTMKRFCRHCNDELKQNYNKILK